jgi:hypothetical protein
MYTVALYDKFNTELIKEIKNESEILAQCVFDTWLKDDACHGETLKMYDGEKTIKEIVIRKPQWAGLLLREL